MSLIVLEGLDGSGKTTQLPLLEALCAAAEAELAGGLREGLAPEDCSDAFRCAAALVVPVESDGDGLGEFHETVALGEMPGTIVRHPHGMNGFGYDPIFMPDEQPQSAQDSGELLTSAQMTPEQKNAISHRGKALRALVPAVKALLAD